MFGFVCDFFAIPSGPQSSKDVIVWWEVRRPVYTVVLVSAGLFSLMAMVTYCPSCFSEPFGLMVGIPLYILAAHFFYTAGWVVELAARSARNRTREPRSRLPKRLLIAGLIFSILLTSAQGVVLITSRITLGDAFTPWSSFTRLEPVPEDLVGLYTLAPESRDRLIDLGYPDTAAFTLELGNGDSATLSSYPAGPVEIDHQPELVNITGEWTIGWIYGYSYGNWGIYIDLPDHVLTDDQRSGHRSTLSMIVRRESPPYELFQWIDRDRKDYIVLKREEAPR